MGKKMPNYDGSPYGGRTRTVGVTMSNRRQERGKKMNDLDKCIQASEAERLAKSPALVKETRKIIECVRIDKEELDKIQSSLDLLIGHNLIGVDAMVTYRGHRFSITLKKQE